jgi:formate-dependent nitrite reductase membrane component NrfD
MPEVTMSGVNSIAYPTLTTWHWHVALYLFVGGLVAGTMIFSSWVRLTDRQGYARAILISDLIGLPFLAIGMLFLWIDLARRWNAWRFYATFQVTSPMSWGSWILLVAMIVLFLRLLTHLPAPVPKIVKWRVARWGRALWRFGATVGRALARLNRLWDLLTLSFGAALGLYTGVLLNTIAARPLWNSSVLPFLFLASGLASGLAFLTLFADAKKLKQLAPVAMTIGGVELFLILSYLLTLLTGAEAARRAATLLFEGPYATTFWVFVVLVGLLLPFLIEAVETRLRHIPVAVARVAPLLALVGGIALRFVIVYAGMASFI